MDQMDHIWITLKFDVIHFFRAIPKGYKSNATQIEEIKKQWITWISPVVFLLYGTSRNRKYSTQVIHLIQVIQNIKIPSIWAAFKKGAGM